MRTPARILSSLLFSFLLFSSLFFPSVCRQVCTPMPSETSDWTNQERDLLDELVPFQCKAGHYNQLASLYFTPPEIALRQLFHFREYDGSDYITFETIPLLLFFLPYFFSSALCSGAYAPTGLFVPLIIAGAAFGRLVRACKSCSGS
jgi:chloride channel 7